MKQSGLCVLLLGWLLYGAASAAPIITVFSAAGDLATVTAERDAFRQAVGGGTTAGANGSFGGVRREINWDGVPDNRADPQFLPADFFNVTSPRGVVFSTPGTGFMVSANAGQAVPIQFGFANQLETFTAQRLFTAVNSPTTDVDFFVAGTNVAATTQAFGAVFTDVDLADQTRIDFFDASGALLTSIAVEASGGDELFSFLGITVDGDPIRSVRITAGTATIVSNGVLGQSGDLVAMDDFLYAEPVRAAAIPEPPAPAVLSLALLCALGVWRFRVRRLRAR